MGDLKSYLRAIIYDVADQFGVEGAVRTRPVPHISLFGPYDTSQGYEAKNVIRDVCSRFELVPFRLNGFGRFGTEVIYVDVQPSPELRQLRRQLATELRPICTEYQPHDSSRYYQFHVTVAKHDIAPQFDEIWSYVTDEFDPCGDQYALRITSLRGRKMLHEYDLLGNRLLSRKEALSRNSWERTKELLTERRSPDDHENCGTLSFIRDIYRQIETKIAPYRFRESV